MPVFVLVALALAAVALGAVAVAARQVLLGVRRLRAVSDDALRRLLPLVEDLQAEVALSATETEAVQDRLAALRSAGSRRDRPAALVGPGAPAGRLD